MKLSYTRFFKDFEPVIVDDKDGPFSGALADYDNFPLVKEAVQKDHRTVWTLIDDNNGWFGIISGFWKINSLGHFITKKPWDKEYTITIEDQTKKKRRRNVRIQHKRKK